MSPCDFQKTALNSLSVLFTACVLLWAPNGVASTKTTAPPMMHITVDLGDQAALRNGALDFAHRCGECHSLQGTRLKEFAQPLDLTRAAVLNYLNPGHQKYLNTIQSSMITPGIAYRFFNKTMPPDLTVIAKRRSADWLYTYLNSFYVDPSRPTGANNLVVYNVSMPDIFATLQGLQKPVMKMGYRFGQRTQMALGVAPLTHGTMTPKQFHTMTRDIVTFLYFVAHPHQQEREMIGTWVMIGLAVLVCLTYLLYKLYWKDVTPPEGGRWWHYWRDRT